MSLYDSEASHSLDARAHPQSAASQHQMLVHGPSGDAYPLPDPGRAQSFCSKGKTFALSLRETLGRFGWER